MVSAITLIVAVGVSVLFFGHNNGVYSVELSGATALGTVIGWLLIDEVAKRIRKENE
jgi:hypothetical protein